MTPTTLVRRSLGHYWRGNLVVLLGVATAVAVLAGALLVGESVRGTLRDLALSRLGATDVAVTSPGFFRDALAGDLAADDVFRATFQSVAPLIAVDGFVTAQTTGRRAGNVRVYGVDERFWQFHGRPRSSSLGPRRAYVSAALAEETGADSGAAILVRVELPSDVPLESLHGRKDDPGRSVRATVEAVLPAEDLGEFSLSQEQGRIRAVFLSIDWLREQLEIGSRANTLLVAARAGPAEPAAALAPILRRLSTVEDSGLTLSVADSSDVIIVGSDAGVIDEPRAAVVTSTAAASGFRTEPVLTYLANTIRVGTREVPYSLVTARDLGSLMSPLNGGQRLSPMAQAARAEARALHPDDPPPIVLNTWAVRELGAKVGDPVQLDYYLWIEPGQLVTREASFRLAAITPIGPDDRDLAPVYPGITDSPTLDAWDPPFPVDLRRVRPVDEAYWKEYRTSPKAFISIADGQRLWGSRYGSLTSIRLRAAPTGQTTVSADALQGFRRALGAGLDPAASGMVARDVRTEAIAASVGVTDFGEYFVYFSFFLVVSALVLAALFFKLGVDERAREVGLFGAVGASHGFVGRLFLIEAAILSGVGGVLGSVAAVGYAAVVVWLLRTVWVGAVGTSALTLHVSAGSIVFGYVGGVAAALGCTWFTLRGLRTVSPRALLAGGLTGDRVTPTARRGRGAAVAAVCAILSLAFMVAGLFELIAAASAFFGAASLMLVAGLAGVSDWFRRPPAHVLAGRGWPAVARLGLRNLAARPSRSAFSVSVIAAAVFILLAVDVFRKDDVADTGPSSGLGGYSLVAESLLPIAHDLGTGSGRAALGLTGVEGVGFDAFRLRPGDDASCLNLYQPTSPRIVGVSQAFIDRGRFSFRSSLAGTDVERRNPWTLLTSVQPDGAVPVIADANSLTYVLHKAVGDLIEIPHEGGTARLRVVAALADSLFQRELLVSDAAFIRLFPGHDGYRFWLAETPSGSTADVVSAIEDRLAAFGVDVLPSAERLAEFHRVENTYLATFQTLGGLGLLLGTVGLSAVLLRNVVERRRELALLGAVGFEPVHIRVMLLAETASLLVAGLVIGAMAAAVASVPTLLERGGRSPVSITGALVVGAVLASGLMATSLAARAATRQGLLSALRSE